MATFNTGWVLANGQEINWTTTSLSDSSTVALIHENKTFDNYINIKEMQDGKAYYYYSSWQDNGSYLYLKNGSQYYKGLKSDGGDKFKKEDIKKKETSYSSSSSGNSNYKTEVERTERLQVRVNEDLNRIIRELGKDSINVSNLSGIVNGISRLRSNKDNIISQKESTIRQKDNTISQKESTIREKDNTISQRDSTIRDKDREIASRKRWASGSRGFREESTTYRESEAHLDIDNMGLAFKPSYIVIEYRLDREVHPFYSSLYALVAGPTCTYLDMWSGDKTYINAKNDSSDITFFSCTYEIHVKSTKWYAFE